MILDAELADLQVQKLINLTQTLTERLNAELDMIRNHRVAEMASGMSRTSEMANEYRRESARVKSNPGLISNASLALKQSLISATEAFEHTLALHSQTIEAARKISEGLVRTIAGEVADARALGTGYLASGHATSGDSRAVALDRKA